MKEQKDGKDLGPRCYPWAVGATLELSAFGFLIKWDKWMSLMFMVTSQYGM